MTSHAIRKDERLHHFVLEEFDRDLHVPFAHVGVAVIDGLLTLFGTVEKDHERLDTLNAARRVDGVRVIVDAISVGVADTDVATDHCLGNQLLQIIETAPAMPQGVTLVVRNNVITLEGLVETAFDRQTVRRLAGYARANWVRDHLVVAPLS
jgi:osmotically-inducible protein OsmY